MNQHNSYSRCYCLAQQHNPAEQRHCTQITIFAPLLLYCRQNMITGDQASVQAVQRDITGDQASVQAVHRDITGDQASVQTVHQDITDQHLI
jgi:hypothetical protein